MIRNKHRSHKWHGIARKNDHISEAVELLICLQECFRTKTGREDV